MAAAVGAVTGWRCCGREQPDPAPILNRTSCGWGATTRRWPRQRQRLPSPTTTPRAWSLCRWPVTLGVLKRPSRVRCQRRVRTMRRPVVGVPSDGRAGSAATGLCQRPRSSRCAQGVDRARSAPLTRRVRLRRKSASPPVRGFRDFGLYAGMPGEETMTNTPILRHSGGHRDRGADGLSRQRRCVCLP